MGLLIDNTLDFAPETAVPATPSAGAKLWVMSDGQLRLTSVGGVTAKVMTDANRPPAIWFTTETGAPVLPTNTLSPLYGQDVVVNDWIVRDSDGEVFKYTGSAVTDQARSIGQGNPVVNTVASGYRTGAASYSAGNNRINIDTKAFDPGACHDVTTNYCYTAPVAGFYHVSGQVRPLYPTSGTEAGLFIAPPGSPTPLIDGDFQYTEAANTYPSLSVDGIIQLAAGQQISLWSYGSSAYSLYVGNGASDNFLSVTLVAPLTAAPVAPNTSMRVYASSTSQNTTTAGWQKVNYATVAAGADPGGHWDTVNLRYKVTQAGTYLVTHGMNSGAPLTVGIGHNGGTTYDASGNTGTSANEPNYGADATDLIFCAVGDYLEPWVFATTAISYAGTSCYFSVVKVDQPVPGPSNTGWFTPTLASGWTAGANPPQYMKDANGFVHTRGSASYTAANSSQVMFTLPAGYRPGINDFSVVLGPGGTAVGYVEPTIAGPFYGSTPTANGLIYINSVTFLAEN
jgi:hypothetical protein